VAPVLLAASTGVANCSTELGTMTAQLAMLANAMIRGLTAQ
jgi:hypothetical protein